MPDWDYPGWWRNAHHDRSVRKVEGSILEKIMERHRRRRMVESALVTTSSILIAVAIVAVTIYAAVWSSRPSSPPPVREERVESVVYVPKEQRLCPR